MHDFRTDAELAGRGDTAAFSRLYSLVYKDMYRTALYNLRNTHDAADAVSDAVADAFENIGRLKKRQREYMNSGAEISPESLYVGEFDFESSELREAVCLLDDESRAILSLSVLGGYKSMEIAEISGIKASTVRSKLSRIKEKLRLSLCE